MKVGFKKKKTTMIHKWVSHLEKPGDDAANIAFLLSFWEVYNPNSKTPGTVHAARPGILFLTNVTGT